MTIWKALFAGLLAAALPPIADAQAEKRVALVIGNSSYAKVRPLPNPAKDAAAMASLFRAAGFDPFAASVLVAKSPCGFRAAYAASAAKILVVRAPGCAPSDFWNYPYRAIPRPLWPWDEIDLSFE